ncbi:MAG: TIGR03667 family PPOX class F420-dependent oxidoreductase [Thermomicrobiales bacterium]
MIDTSTEFGARVERRLSDEPIIWLTTVRHDGTPQPSPVWFLWDGETFLIYSQPNTPKLRNIARNPTVALHLNGDRHGNDIVIFAGDARIADDAPPVDTVPAFVTKYREDLAPGGAAENMARDYTVAIRVTPTGLRGF